METRKIGTLEISVIGVGCNNFGKRVDAVGTSKVVSAALDAGINFFDTADIYGNTLSEAYLGNALKGTRDRVVIATKFGMQLSPTQRGAKPNYVKEAVEASLHRLRTDYIDLYQLHQPDPDTPIADTLGALDDLVKAGKVREIGCSNFSAAQLAEAMQARPGCTNFASLQNGYSLLNREAEIEVLPACYRYGMKFIPYFPLASGLLSGKYHLGDPQPDTGRFAPGGWGSQMYTTENLALVERLRAFAEKNGLTLLELAFSWLLSQPGVVSVIAGAMREEQVRDNARAFVRSLTATELSEISQILGKP